eukprot:5207537-Prymnesium_polylepis.1
MRPWGHRPACPRFTAPLSILRAAFPLLPSSAHPPHSLSPLCARCPPLSTTFRRRCARGPWPAWRCSCVCGQVRELSSSVSDRDSTSVNLELQFAAQTQQLELARRRTAEAE